ncbi:MAG: NifB/NifX family molybdenum-iron cluster-binding protein [Anaerolineae bacterium]|nr:NifB/NifX family molybdenum-iron cluster-binding protein [Anaerolineae bacterium]
MRVAVSSADARGLDGSVSSHFGRCPYFTMIDIADGVIEQVSVVENPHYDNHQPGQVPGFVHAQRADMIVAGGMGRRAIMMFEQLGIGAHTGTHAKVRDAVEAALGGHLEEAAPCAGHGGSGDCEDHPHATHH